MFDDVKETLEKMGASAEIVEYVLAILWDMPDCDCCDQRASPPMYNEGYD